MPAFATELITSTKTRIGAIAFNAPTNMLPKIAITVSCGNAIPKIAPITRPTAILKIKLMSFHFLINVFICLFPFFDFIIAKYFNKKRNVVQCLKASKFLI